MLIGRAQELEEIAAALEHASLVTLTGPGGVGKTTLAKAAAAGWPDDTTMFADLTALDAEDLEEGVAGSLGFSSFGDLLAEVGERNLLLVLDNCEHLVDAAADVADRLLAAGPQLKVLATSRERLDLGGEISIRIDPLPTEGSPSPAAEMFLDAAASRGLTPTDDPAVIDELCRRLDGLPLALELAAARASAMTAAEMISHLDSRLDLLSRRRHRGPERHASLGATIGWSYQQLGPEERLLFTQLSVLRSPFTTGMAAAVGDLSPADTLTILDTLVERSLLVHHPIAGTSTYRMLETIKHFAGDELEDQDTVETRLLEYLTVLADEMFADGVMTHLAAPVELEYSFRNLYWAVDQVIEQGDLERVLRLIAPWWWLEDVGHQAEASELLERIIAHWPEVTPETAIVWGTLALLTPDGDRYQEAATVAASSTGLGAAYGTRMLGFSARRRTEWDLAVEHFGKAIDIAEAAGQRGLALETQMHAALARARAGDLDAAVHSLEEVIAASEAYAMPRAMATDFLAFVLLPHDPARSAELARSLLPLTADNVWLRAACSYTLGGAALAQGDIPTAAAHLDDSIEAFSIIRSGAESDIVLAYLYASTLFVSIGDVDTARAVIGGKRHTFLDKMGPDERGLLERLGPLPEIEGEVPPMPADEVRHRLQQIARGETDDAAPSPGVVADHRFLRTGDTWTIAYGGIEIQMRHSKGLADLAALLRRPGVEIAALDLMDAGVVTGDSGPASDATARQQYEQRIRELQDDIDHATDSHRAEKAREELDALVDHLTAAYGLGGKERSSGEPAEKARSAVTWRIRSSIKKITAAHPDLGEHLDRSFRTGRFCVYDPAEPVRWETNR